MPYTWTFLLTWPAAPESVWPVSVYIRNNQMFFVFWIKTMVWMTSDLFTLRTSPNDGKHQGKEIRTWEKRCSAMQRIWQTGERHTWFTDVSELQAPRLPSIHGSAFKLGINEGLGLLSSGLRDFSSWQSVWEFPARSHSDAPLRSEDRKSTSVSSRMWSWAGSGLTHGFVPAWRFNRAYITPVTHLNGAFCRPTAPHTEKLFPSSLCCSMRPGTMQTTSSLTPSDAQ